MTPARPMYSVWRQWAAVFRACAQENLAYAAQAVIWILTDVMGNILMLLVFLAAGQGRNIQGYSSSDFAVYFIGLVGISGFVTCHMQWEINLEIKDGMVSTFMLRPISWYQFMMIRNLAWRVLRLAIFIPGLLIFVVLFWGVLKDSRPNLSIEFWVAFLLGHAVSVTLVLAMSMLAFMVEDATALFESYYLPMLFLSGQIFPMALLPTWAQVTGKALPFFYTTGVPVEILVGHLKGQAAWPYLAGQCVWIGVNYLLFRWGWAVGTKKYTGIGM